MLFEFPKAVPEIPVGDLENATGYYVNVLGFRLDWCDDQSGIRGISQGECRIFLANQPFRQQYLTKGTIVIWLNLNSRQEVDALFQRWRDAGARIVAEPEDMPWNLREFRAADLDGNLMRVFYDFTGELRRES